MARQQQNGHSILHVIMHVPKGVNFFFLVVRVGGA